MSSEWIRLADEVDPVKRFVSENFGHPKLSGIHDTLQSQLEHKERQIQISSNLRKAELLGQRRILREAVARGVPAAQTKLNNCEQDIKALPKKREEAETNGSMSFIIAIRMNRSYMHVEIPLAL